MATQAQIDEARGAVQAGNITPEQFESQYGQPYVLSAPTATPEPTPTTSTPTTQNIPGFNTSIQAISDAVATIDPDFSKLQETIRNIGFTPRTEEEQLIAIRAAYSPEELQALGVDQQFQELEQSRNTAQANLQATSLPTDSALGVLAEALNAKSNVTNQSLGASDLFKQAGLPTEGVSAYATLSQSLQQRSNEMTQNFNSFKQTLGDTAGAMSDVYNTALSKYQVLNEDYQKQIDRTLAIQQSAVDYERQLSIMDQQAQAQKELYNMQRSEYKYNGDGTFTNANGEILYPDYGDTDASGDLDTVQYDGVNGGNCVFYTRETYPNMPSGLTSIENRRKWVDTYGFTLSENIPQIGDVVHTSEGDVGHTAKIIGFDANGNMVLDEANYRAGQVTQGRLLALDDPKVIGFWNPGGTENTQMSSIDPNTGEITRQAVGFGNKTGDVQGDPTEGENPYGAETYNGGSSIPSSYGDMGNQFDNVMVGLFKSFTDSETAAAKNVFDNYIAKGDMAGANNYLDVLSMQTLGGTQKSNLQNIETSTIEANNALALINDLKFTNLSYYKTAIEQNKKYVGLEKDQEWVQVSQAIEAAQAELRRYYYGTAVTESEVNTAKNLFIDVESDDISTVMTKLSGLSELANSTRRRMLDQGRGIFSDDFTTSGGQMETQANPLGL